jgi:hypothetical protein
VPITDNAEALVSILEGPDNDVGCFAHDRCMETPSACFILATDGVTIFVGLNSRKFKGLCDCKASLRSAIDSKQAPTVSTSEEEVAIEC